MAKIVSMDDEQRKKVFAEVAADMEPVRLGLDAVERLIAVAQRDTGQSRKVADFLLAWWNAEECGGCDLVALWGVDEKIAEDMATVFAFLAKWHHYPDALGFKKQFEELVRLWRPELGKESGK
jgi:hypothetical protein